MQSPVLSAKKCHFTYPLQWLVAIRLGPLDAISVGFTSWRKSEKKKKKSIESADSLFHTRCPLQSCKTQTRINEQVHKPENKLELQGFTVYTYTGCDLCGSWTWPFLHWMICLQEKIDQVLLMRFQRRR